MVNNGYLSWSTTITPMKDGVTYKCIRFSEWLDSMRKDVECTFGIMKGRFCILRYGIQLKSIEKCDKIWKTCCTLHNMLLFIDGLHKDWDKGASSGWEISNNKFQKRNLGKFAINCLCNLESCSKDEDKEGSYEESDYSNLNEYLVNGKRVVRKIPMKLFQKHLIEHFDIRF